MTADEAVAAQAFAAELELTGVRTIVDDRPATLSRRVVEARERGIPCVASPKRPRRHPAAE